MDIDEAGPLAGDISFLLARANAMAAATTNAALVEHGLRVRSFAVLALANSSAGMNQREIADYLRLDPSQVVALVDGLQTQGYVERKPDPRDRRTNVVSATPAGQAAYAVAQATVQQSERVAHAALSDSESAMLAHLLRKAAFPGA